MKQIFEVELEKNNETSDAGYWLFFNTVDKSVCIAALQINDVEANRIIEGMINQVAGQKTGNG